MNNSEGGQAAKPSMCSSLLQDFQSIDLRMQRVFWKIMTLYEFREHTQRNKWNSSMAFVVKVFGSYLRAAFPRMQLNTDGKTYTSQQFTP